MEFVDVKTQAELDKALKRKGVRPRCVGSGVFRVGGSATVYAGGSATVYAGGSATVYAGGSATVYARGSATVYAGDYNAIHRTSTLANIKGGVVIDPPPDTVEGFLALQRLKVEDGLVA